MGLWQNTECNQVLETGAGVRTRCSVDVALPIAKHPFSIHPAGSGVPKDILDAHVGDAIQEGKMF